MKKNLILHIGSGKAGSTALQQSFRNNVDYLNKLGFDAFPHDTNDYYNCSMVYYSKYYKAFLQSVDKLHAVSTVEDLIFYILEKSKNKAINNLIVSFEGFNSLSLHDIQNMYNLLKDYNIKIVCYLRRQDYIIESFYNQSIKGLLKLIPINDDYLKTHIDNVTDRPFKKFYKNPLIELDYYSMLNKFAHVFSKENIIVRVYEKSQMPNGIIEDFYIHILGISLEQLQYIILPKKTSNERLNRDVLEFKLEFPLITPETTISISNRIGDININQEYFTDEERLEILEYYREGNEKIAMEYLNRENRKLFYDDVKQNNSSYRGLTDEKRNEILYYLSLEIAKNPKNSMFDYFKFAKIAFFMARYFKERILLYGVAKGVLGDRILELGGRFSDVITGISDQSFKGKTHIYDNNIYHVYQFDEIKELMPDIIMICSEFSGKSIYHSLKRLELTNTVILPIYDVTDKAWFNYISKCNPMYQALLKR